MPQSLAAPSEDGHYIIPKGHTAVASPGYTQIDKRIWHKAETWDPYRWADPSGAAAKALQEYLGGGDKVDYGYGTVSKGTDSVYQPFGAGRHRCIGEHVRFGVCYSVLSRTDASVWQFAYLQVGTILATIVRNIEMQLDEIPKPDHSVRLISLCV